MRGCWYSSTPYTGGMRSLFLGGLCFIAGMTVQAHLVEDDARELRRDVRDLERYVETLAQKANRLEVEAAELRMRTKTLFPNISL